MIFNKNQFAFILFENESLIESVNSVSGSYVYHYFILAYSEGEESPVYNVRERYWLL